MSDFALAGNHRTGERRILALFADAAASRAEQLGIPHAQGACGCGLPEFCGDPGCVSAEASLRSMGVESESPESIIQRVEAVEFLIGLLLKSVSPTESRALLDYFAGDMGAFSRHTGIRDKRGADSYVALRLEKLAAIIREKNIRSSEFY